MRAACLWGSGPDCPVLKRSRLASGARRANDGCLRCGVVFTRDTNALRRSGRASCPRRSVRVTARGMANSSSELIDAKLASLGDWRGEMLNRLRALIHDADPAVVETVKWRKPSNPMGVPVWEHDGIICTGETYKDKVKLTFAQGASLPDPSGLFNSSLDGTPAARSTFLKATTSMRTRSRRWFARRLRSIEPSRRASPRSGSQGRDRVRIVSSVGTVAARTPDGSSTAHRSA